MVAIYKFCWEKIILLTLRAETLVDRNFGGHEKMQIFLQKLWRNLINLETNCMEKNLKNLEKKINFRLKLALFNFL